MRKCSLVLSKVLVEGPGSDRNVDTCLRSSSEDTAVVQTTGLYSVTLKYSHYWHASEQAAAAAGVPCFRGGVISIRRFCVRIFYVLFA